MSTNTGNERETKLAQSVLSTLDRWDERLQGHQNQKRNLPGNRFRTRVTVYLVETGSIPGECAESAHFDVWSRNLSRAGMSFIYRGRINTENIVVCLEPVSRHSRHSRRQPNGAHFVGGSH